ncbi:MAG TPA: DUF6067 family protein [Gemmatimonadales bacterium]|nr:DUF6067 family protein [Gemmatimonadales bacterium]HRZ09685.1 DUF6067 family protein [Gemmatimonadales bacterium]
MRLSRFALVLLVGSALASPATAQDPVYRIGRWTADSFGNHRAVVSVDAAAPAVWAHLPWRRPDLHPESKGVWVVDARTGHRVMNVARGSINRESGDIAFEPTSGPGEYYIYYLRYAGSVTSNYPKLTYPGPDSTASAAWLALFDPRQLDRLPQARLVAFEAADTLDSFYPMQVIATKAETDRVLARSPSSPFLVFSEDRTHPIVMPADLPARWVSRTGPPTFSGTAFRGEFYAFQLGVWAARAPLADARVLFWPLTGAGGEIPASAIRCFNQGGVDWQGRGFKTPLVVPQGRVQPLWCGVQVPLDARAGRYKGHLTVWDPGADGVRVELTLDVEPDTIRNGGADEPWRLARLAWLDSRLEEDHGIVPPYTPVSRRGDTLGVLGRKMVIGTAGFPRSLQSLFTIEMTSIGTQPRELLAGPIRLVAEDAAGREMEWDAAGFRVVVHDSGRIDWISAASAGPLHMLVHGSLEFDGNAEFSVALTADSALAVRDIRLEIPLRPDVARYMMGLGVKGGRRPDSLDWTWEVKHNQDGAWLGDVNAGLQFSLKDDKYSRPLNTNFYLSKPLVMPASWANAGRGGCRLRARREAYTVVCYSGARTMARGQSVPMEQGEVQHFDFRLLLTPFHPIDTKAQWATRYFHAYVPLDSITKMGANTVNVHHATAINPFINYPFLRPEAMKAYVDSAHAMGIRVKIYYTVRELTNHAPEIPALQSLGTEVIAPGPGGGASWLQEHLDTNYIGGWYVPAIRDAAVVNTGISRWHNFYVEGLDWLVDNVGIDGLYIDDVAFDRSIMVRVRKALTRGRPAPLIDLHSANQYNPRDGFASSANLYLEHFPFIDRLWFGEYFDYNASPAYWLVEMSGIPFGLMGEMLEGGGNPWRGMVFGMTNRLPWSGDPRELWKFWDTYKIQDTRMIGFWVPGAPVRTGRPDVLATVYQGEGRSIVALASWAADTAQVQLAVDWTRLGLDPARARVVAPELPGYQSAASFKPFDPIPVAPGRGWLLIFEPTAGSGAP